MHYTCKYNCNGDSGSNVVQINFEMSDFKKKCFTITELGLELLCNDRDEQKVTGQHVPTTSI